MRSEEVFKPGDPPDPGQLSLIKPHLPSFVKGTLATVGQGTLTKKDPSGTYRAKTYIHWGVHMHDKVFLNMAVTRLTTCMHLNKEFYSIVEGIPAEVCCTIFTVSKPCENITRD